MHVDPAVKVLATTEFPVADGPHTPNGRFDMPVVWTKYYGKGKVFYNSLGHQANVVESEPCLTSCEEVSRGRRGNAPDQESHDNRHPEVLRRISSDPRRRAKRSFGVPQDDESFPRACLV
jgi:type 1 glutamine amidotransferase